VYVLFFGTVAAVQPELQLKESVVLSVPLDFAVAGGGLAAVVYVIAVPHPPTLDV